MLKGTEEDPLIELAKETIEEWIRFGRKKMVPNPLPPDLQKTAGAFVCLKQNGQLRGCIGTIEPSECNLAAEIINNAISSATRDPRFDPVAEDELSDLEYTVDVLTEPEPVCSFEELDPKRYGVIVESGYKRGLLLPDLEGVDTVEYQVSIAARKAGIYEGEPVNLYRFEVVRHGE
jgi:AmmeMemoRadiSam system protein A